MTPSQRVARVFELTEAHHAQQRESIRATYPEADEREVFCGSLRCGLIARR